MPVDLAGYASGHPERFVPELMGGELIAAQHFGRYWWSAQLVRGKRVLDAGCGVAYGSRILGEAGAREVVGIDTASDVLDAVRGDAPANVELVHGDITELPFPDGSFDVVVCFEVIEHVDDPERIVDELARVLSDDGVLAISTPNRRVFPAGNPHHRHELVPAELDELLATRFSIVRLVRQHDWLASGILADEDFGAAPGAPLEEVRVRKLQPAALGDELFTLALAGNGGLPSTGGLAVLGDRDEFVALQQAFREAVGAHEEHSARLEEALVAQTNHASRLDEALAAQTSHTARLEEATATKDEAIARLDSEVRARAFDLRQRDAALAQLNERLFELERGVAWQTQVNTDAVHELELLHATKLFRYSASLRRIYGLARGFRPRS